MTIENIIIVKGGAYSDIKKALRQWIDLYSEDFDHDLVFQLYKNGRGYHVIQVDERLENEKFYFLVNYLKYPEDIEYKVSVEGFTTGKDSNKLQGRELMVYVPEFDEDYDYVSVVSSDNCCFKVDFGGKITDELDAKKYKFPEDLSFNDPEVISFERDKYVLSSATENIDKSIKRIKIISVLIFSVLLLTFVFFNTWDEWFINTNYFIPCAMWFWFMIDYKILQVTRLYYTSVAIGLVIFLYGRFLDVYLLHDHNGLVGAGTTMPIFFLLIQRPARWIFMALMKREPVPVKPFPSIADGFYAIILWVGSLIGPMFYFYNEW